MKVLHLGCGPDIRIGWTNIDLGADVSRNDETTTVISHDLRYGLPVEDNSFDMVYSSHFFEHLNTTDGLRLMHNCFRVIKSGGFFRAAMPDARLAIRAYLAGDDAYFEMSRTLIPTDLPPREICSPIDFIDRDARAWEHQALYDPVKMERMLLNVGFSNCREADFDGVFDIGHEFRRRFSFYIEAQKPLI